MKFKKLRLAQLVAQDRPIVYGIVQAGEHLTDGVPYIRSTDVGGRIEPNNLLKTSPEIAARFGRSRVSPGDIVFSLRGNIGETSIVPDCLDGANLTQGTARISINREYNAAFVRYALSHTEIHRHILSVAKGSTFHEITLEDLRNVELPTPPLPEQQKIADILGTWDEALEKLDSLIDAKARRKQALMQQLLTGHRRLPGFSKPWVKSKLGDIFLNRTENNRLDLPLLSITADQGVVSRDSLTKRDTSSEDKSKYLRIAPGDIGYNTMRMWQGVSALSTMEGIVSPAYTILTPTSQIAGRFAAHFFKLRHTISLFHRHSQGLVDDTLNLKYPHFAKIQVTVPNDVAEQRAIAAVLDTADAELRLLRQQRTALDHQKRGLMQQLLTGKVRVSI